MARKILCVAEKPAIARAVATHLSGGSFQTVSCPGKLTKLYQLIYPHSILFVGINMSRIMSLTSTLAVRGGAAPLL